MIIDGLDTNRGVLLIPSNLHVLMTGAYRLEIKSGEVHLFYTDGSEETVPESVLVGVDTDNWLALVSAIQAQRPRT